MTGEFREKNRIDVLCIGTAVVDISASSLPKRDDWMEKQRIGQISMMAGGDAVNQSIRMADAGLKVELAAAIGRDTNGTFLQEALKRRMVGTEYLVQKKEYDTGTSLVLVDVEGERNTFSVKGAHGMLKQTELPGLTDLKKQGLLALSIGSLFSLPVLEDHGLAEYLKEAKSLGIRIFADLGSDKRNQGLSGIRHVLPYIDYFLPSDYDIRQLTKERELDRAAEVLLDCGCGHVIVKCGKDGCRCYSDVEKFQVSALPVKALDTTGAGDCMVALFIARILKGESCESACRYACAGASLSTLYPGASVRKIEETEINKMIHIGT